MTKRFDEFKIGDKFYSTCKITKKDLDDYLQFSQTKNAFLDNNVDNLIIPGRALLAKIEGAFTRLQEIQGNYLILIGTDGDPNWGYRNARFLMPFYTDALLNVEYEISNIANVNEDFGRISIDYKGTDNDGNLILLAKRNIYQIKKDYKKTITN